MENKTQELNNLYEQRKEWIDKYSGFANVLCLAVLALGEIDNLEDPVAVRRHNMICKSLVSDTVKIIATEKQGDYLPSKMDFALTRRLIVKDGQHQPVYLTLTDDPDAFNQIENNIFVPGLWMDYARQVLSKYDDLIIEQTSHDLSQKLTNLRGQMLIGINGFGHGYE